MSCRCTLVGDQKDIMQSDCKSSVKNNSRSRSSDAHTPTSQHQIDTNAEGTVPLRGFNGFRSYDDFHRSLLAEGIPVACIADSIRTSCLPIQNHSRELFFSLACKHVSLVQARILERYPDSVSWSRTMRYLNLAYTHRSCFYTAFACDSGDS